jgi:hypothetical protein
MDIQQKGKCSRFSNCTKTYDSNHTALYYHECKHGADCYHMNNIQHTNNFVHPCPNGSNCTLKNHIQHVLQFTHPIQREGIRHHHHQRLHTDIPRNINNRMSLRNLSSLGNSDCGKGK